MIKLIFPFVFEEFTQIAAVIPFRHITVVNFWANEEGIILMPTVFIYSFFQNFYSSVNVSSRWMMPLIIFTLDYGFFNLYD